jgi:hypothetical protein
MGTILSLSLLEVLPVTALEKLCHCCIMKTIKLVKDSPGKWESKLQLLMSHFDFPVAALLGESDMYAMIDDLLSLAWSFKLPVVQGLDGAIINIANPPNEMCIICQPLFHMLCCL